MSDESAPELLFFFVASGVRVALRCYFCIRTFIALSVLCVFLVCVCVFMFCVAHRFMSAFVVLFVHTSTSEEESENCMFARSAEVTKKLLLFPVCAPLVLLTRRRSRYKYSTVLDSEF